MSINVINQTNLDKITEIYYQIQKEGIQSLSDEFLKEFNKRLIENGFTLKDLQQWAAVNGANSDGLSEF